MGVPILGLPYILLWISEFLQHPNRVCGEVDLNSQQRVVVVPPETVHLIGVQILIKLMPQRADLLTCCVVDALPDKPVRALARGIAADDIGHTLLRLLPDGNVPVLRIDPPDTLIPDAHLAPLCIVVGIVGKQTAPYRPRQVIHTLSNLTRVEHRLAVYAPLPKAVHRIVVWVGVAERLQRLYVVVVQKPVILVRRVQHRRAVILLIEEPLFEPVQRVNRVEG